MKLLDFALHLGAAVMLLLFAVRLVRGGLERLIGSDIERVLTRKGGQATLVGTGLLMALVLQSSAAVSVLIAGFAANGAIGFTTGLPIVLGAELGTALLARLLSLPLEWLTPALMLGGGWLFLNGEAKTARNFGRVLLGVAMVLVSLRLLREAVDPIRESDLLPVIAAYLDRDAITAFLLGALVAFAFHSGLAAVLTCLALVQAGAVPLGAGISLVFGANFGSALVVVWLTRRMAPAGYQLAFAALCLRGAVSLLLLGAFAWLPIPLIGTLQPGMALLAAHIGLNLLVVLVGLPLRWPLARLAEYFVPRPSLDPDTAVSALDPTVQNVPALALASMRREVLRMHEMLEQMIAPIPALLEKPDDAARTALAKTHHKLTQALDDLRAYAAHLPLGDWTKSDVRACMELTDYATDYDRAGTIAADRLLPLTSERRRKAARLDSVGQAYLMQAIALVRSNLQLAAHLLVTDDLGGARLLVLGKSRLAALERKARKKLQRQVIQTDTIGAAGVDLVLDLMQALKDINSQCAAVGYRLLDRQGQLRKTRLIGDKLDA